MTTKGGVASTVQLVRPHQVYVDFGNGHARFEVSSEDAVNALLMLAARRNDDRAWGMVRLVLEYDRETPEEKENIESALLEILRNEPIELPVA